MTTYRSRLTCSHGAFNGTSSEFNRLRKAVCEILGPEASYPPHEDVDLKGTHFYLPAEYTQDRYPGLWEFLGHSDQWGDIKPNMCKAVVKDLAPIVLKLWGFLPIGYGATLMRFCLGCAVAAKKNEALEFTCDQKATAHQ